MGAQKIRRRRKSVSLTVDGRQLPALSDKLAPPDVERFRLSELVSRCTVPLGDGAHRTDPFWSGLWEASSTAHWSVAGVGRQLQRAGLGRTQLPDKTPQQFADQFVHGHDRAGRLSMLAAVEQWRCLSVEQARAFSGVRYVSTGPESVALKSAFGAGLIDVGVLPAAMSTATLADSRMWLLRPSASGSFDDLVSPSLTYPEWVSVTSGYPWRRSSPYDRHNVLAAELALRAAEYCDVATVFGEKLSTVDLLMNDVAPSTTLQSRAADGLLVRPDGLRIAIELTASVGADFPAKVDRWCRELFDKPLGRSGLVVVFVLASAPYAQDVGTGLRLRREIAKAVKRCTARYPGVAGESVADRIFVTEWREWFPAERVVTERFLRLNCSRPTGVAESSWERVDLVGPDAMPVQWWDQAGALELIRNAQLLAATPFWLRDASLARPLWKFMFDRAEVPVSWCDNPFGRDPGSTFRPVQPVDASLIDAPAWGAPEVQHRLPPNPRPAFPPYWPTSDINGELLDPAHASQFYTAVATGQPLPVHPDAEQFRRDVADGTLAPVDGTGLFAEFGADWDTDSAAPAEPDVVAVDLEAAQPELSATPVPESPATPVRGDSGWGW